MANKKQPGITVKSTEDRKEYDRQYRINNKETIRTYEETESRKKANATRIREKKCFLIEFAGGKCSHCGLLATKENSCMFDFHHIQPKNFNMAPYTISMARLLEESKICILLCSNCHRLEHKEQYL